MGPALTDETMRSVQSYLGLVLPAVPATFFTTDIPGFRFLAWRISDDLELLDDGTSLLPSLCG